MTNDKIKINIEYENGNIQWCNNPKIGHKYAIYFSETKYKDKQNILLKIQFDIDNEIFKKIEYIDIKDDNNKSIIVIKKQNFSSLYDLSIPIKDTTKYLNIYFVSIIKSCFFSIFSKNKYKIIYQILHDLPNFYVLDKDDECYICLENIDYTNYYITPCKHKFHSTCIYEYLDYNKLLIDKNLYCLKNCNHERKNKSFNCPICRNYI